MVEKLISTPVHTVRNRLGLGGRSEPRTLSGRKVHHTSTPTGTLDIFPADSPIVLHLCSDFPSERLPKQALLMLQ